MIRRTNRRACRWPGWLALSCMAWLPGLSLALPAGPERLEWHGKTYDLLSEPLEQRYPGGQGRPRFHAEPGRDAGAGRGYAGRWRLEDDRLYLVDIDTWLCGGGVSDDAGCRRATLPILFGAAPGQVVFAGWFSGELVLSETALARPAPGAGGARTIRVTLKAGKVTRIETLDGDGGSTKGG